MSAAATEITRLDRGLHRAPSESATSACVRVVRRIKRHAVWLDAPHFATPLYTYGALWVRFVELHSVKAEPVEDWSARALRALPPHRIAAGRA
jgi:hypothetical protein